MYGFFGAPACEKYQMCSLFCALCECLLMNQAQDARPEPDQIPTSPAVSASMKRDGGAKIASFAPLRLCFGFLRQSFGLASGRFHPQN